MNYSDYTVPKEQANSLLELALSLPFAKNIIGSADCRGIRFVFFGAFAIESYTSFQEPKLKPWRGIRLVFWKKLEGGFVNDWKKWPGIPIGRSFAIAKVHPDFTLDWTANARRLVQRQKEAFFTVKKVNVQEFGKAYHQSGYLDPLLRHGFLRVIRDHLRVHPNDVSMLLFENPGGVLLGGTVFVDYPDIQQSHYLISFLTPEGRQASVGYAFIYWWYQDMLKKSLTWADFGIVWQKGDPISWQGYSQFKKRFNPGVFTKKSYWKMG